MQSTTPVPPPMAASFHQIVASIPDPRSPRGRRSSLPALVAGAAAAMAANHTSVLAIAEWIAALCPHAKHALGFPPGAAPHQTTFARVFRRLDPTLLAQALTAAQLPRRAHERPPRGQAGVAIDGKAQRGRHTTGGSAVHAISLVDHRRAMVLAQTPLTSPTEHELTAALRLLPDIPWSGRVLTGNGWTVRYPYVKPGCMLAVMTGSR